MRLRRGEMADATVYTDDPAGQARAWQAAGFLWLHVVDLNGAFAGRSVNTDALNEQHCRPISADLVAQATPVVLERGHD